MELSSRPTRFDPFSRDGCPYVFSFLLFEPICTFAGEIKSIWTHSFNSLSCCLMRIILWLQIRQSLLLAAMISYLWRTWAVRSEIVVLQVPCPQTETYLHFMEGWEGYQVQHWHHICPSGSGWPHPSRPGSFQRAKHCGLSDLLQVTSLPHCLL